MAPPLYQHLVDRSANSAATFNPFELTIPHIAYACIGGFVVLFGMFSLVLREKLYIGEANWAFLFGIIIGPYGANVFNPRRWGSSSSDGTEANEDVTNQVTLEFSRVVLSIGVFAIGVELPKQYMKRHWRSLAFLLGPVMTWGWFVSAGLIYALVPALDFLSSLAVAACLTPTDPILAAAVVGGKFAEKHVPAHIRHLLAAESGCNDGAAFPFLFIALFLILNRHNTGAAIRDWFLLLWLYQVVLGVVIGSTFGIAFRHLMKFCESKGLIDRHSYVAQYISLALLTTGVTTLLGSDDLLSTFCCGSAFAWDGFFNRQTEEAVFSSVIDLLFNIAAFVFIGAWMPFKDFQDAELTLQVWKLVVLAIGVLLLRRIPVVLACYRWIPDIKTIHEALFTGHFGPMGVGGVFISTLANEFLHTARQPSEEGELEQIDVLEKSIQPIVAFLVMSSIVVHGMSIPSFSLGRRVHSVTMSRTWSRRRTFSRGRSMTRTRTGGAGGEGGGEGGGGMPEWMDQARRVERGGAEIVINRDPEDKTEIVVGADGDGVGEKTGARGEGEGSSSNGEGSSRGTPEKMRMDTSSPVPPMPKDVEREGEGGEGEKVEMKEESRADVDGEERWKEENLPDGDEIVAEWEEGNWLVVERRKGAGEEVEVEVIRKPGTGTGHDGHEHEGSSAGAGEGKKTTFTTTKEHAQSRIRAHLKHLEDEVKKFEDAVVHSHTSLSSRGSGGSRKGRKKSVDYALRPMVVGEEAQRGEGEVVEDEDEEGWVPAEEDGDGEVERSRSKSPPSTSKSKRVGAGSGMKMKRRSSHSSSTVHAGGGLRKAIMGRLGRETTPRVVVQGSSPTESSSTTATPDADADSEDRRGRSSSTSLPAFPGGGTGGFKQHRDRKRKGHSRVDSLRLDASTPLAGRSREASPARSIRFVEGLGGDVERPSTPRTSASGGFGERAGTTGAAGGNGSGNGGNGGEERKVTFEDEVGGDGEGGTKS